MTLASEIDITGRFDSAFGFAIKNTVPRLVKFNPYGFQGFEQEESEFEDVILRYEDKSLNFAAFPFIQKNKIVAHIPLSNNADIDYGDVIAPPPLLNFSARKNLIETELQGDEVEVVERWNTSNYDIRMRGILVDMNEHHYPTDLVSQLHLLFKYNGIIAVSGTQFFEKDIDNLYIIDYEINGVVGYSDTVQYTILARAASELGSSLIIQ